MNCPTCDRAAFFCPCPYDRDTFGAAATNDRPSQQDTRKNISSGEDAFLSEDHAQ